VLEQPADFGSGEVQLILPDVAIFVIRVFAHQLVIGHDRVGAWITTGEAVDREAHVVVIVYRRAVVHRIRQEPGAFVLLGTIEAQERMAEHGRRIVHVRRREDQRDPFGVDRGEPGCELRAALLRHALGIPTELRFQPAEPGDEGALRMRSGRIGGWRSEERGERRLEFGSGILLAVFGREELRAVDQAGPARAQEVGPVVAEIEPFAPFGQPLGARPRPQLRKI
jgi:hypothetical protein